MQGLDVPLNHFGFYQGAIALVFATLSITSPYFLEKFGTRRCFYFGFIICIITAFFISSLLLFNVQNPYIITSMMLLFAIGAVFPINILYPYSLDIIPGGKARTAALHQSSRLIVTACLLETTGYFYEGNFLSLGIGMLIPLVTSLWIVYQLRQNQWLALNDSTLTVSAAT
jgi:DHA1 family bicyclomycin/chloramphenicol resistance-like MFS transporter